MGVSGSTWVAYCWLTTCPVSGRTSSKRSDVTLRWRPSIDQLNEQLRRGLIWDLAFVDFNLSSQTSTGLTALLRLHHERPATQTVTYSQFTESGRTLYAAAAHHWFKASALMDKTKNDPGTLVHYRESICNGVNPDAGALAAAPAVGSADRQPAR